MNKSLLTILFSFIVVISYCQEDDHQLYDHELDENKWEKIRDGIRYEGSEDQTGAGRQWTYESDEEYERARKNSGGGSGSGSGGGGNGTGGSGSGASEAPQDHSSSRSSRPPRVSSPGLGGMSVLGYIILAAFVVGLIFLIFYLFMNAPKKGKKVGDDEIVLEDVNPTEIPLTELQRRLQEALNKGDYRGAVRIYFIFIIRDLAQRNWIQWQKEKTNFHYLREMTGKSEYDDFNRTVSYFEVIWYGKRELDEQKFNQIKPAFTRLLEKLGVK